MNIYIVRHGQTHWNEQGRMQGAKNSDLTSRGIEEAKKLNAYISDVKFDRIYVSPLGRTLETMKYVKGDLDIPIVELEELKEMNFGEFEGQVLDELREKYPREMEYLWTKPEKYTSTSGEAYEEVFNRVKTAMDKITSQDGENILVVTHGVIISVLLSIVKDKPIEKLWDTPVVKNTSFSILKHENGKIGIVEENIIEHLK